MVKAAVNPELSSDLAIPANDVLNLDDVALSSVSSYSDALALLESMGVVVEDGANYGNGFTIVDKKTLVGEPMVLLSWRFNDGIGTFVSVEAVTEKGVKVVFNDGSQYGICAQLAAITNKRNSIGQKNPQAGLTVRHGLSESSYTNDAGIDATTYRLVF